VINIKTGLKIDVNDICSLQSIANEARKLIIDMAATPTGCHIGGSLSVIDLLIGTYAKYIDDNDTVIVLSKGHAAAALYATLYIFELVKENPALTYGSKDSLYIGHPNHKIDNVRFSTGSLGHGIAYAAGWALGKKLEKSQGLGIAIGGDGELQEGLCWETAQIVQSKEINNFVYIVDCNGAQNDGYIQDISPLSNITKRFESFGFRVEEINGHNMEEIVSSIDVDNKKPLAILANTIKGKGVAAIEGNPDSHYAKITDRLATKWKRGIV